MDANAAKSEWLKCSMSIDYFVTNYVYIENATISQWIRFSLWPAQIELLNTFRVSRKVITLKARQLGISWLSLSYALWLLLFHSPATILLFSRTGTEAKELLARLRKMYSYLPSWMQSSFIEKDTERELILSIGSRAMCFTSKGGRSFTGTLLICDEFDFIENQNEFLKAVKPTIDAGAQMFLISTSDKANPLSVFKNLFRAALKGAGEYVPIFIPWYARPGRTQEWYESIKAEMFAQRHTNDDLYAEYPASAEEALAAEELDRRYPWAWIKQCLVEKSQESCGLGVVGLRVFLAPVSGHRYLVVADPAEGNPRSDDSAAMIFDFDTWQQCAVIQAKTEPSQFAAALDSLGEYYNNASAMIARNNHGHTVIAQMRDSGTLQLLDGEDGKAGYQENTRTKTTMHNALAQVIQDKSITFYDAETTAQLSMIQASDLSAPPGLHDDLATCCALAAITLTTQRPAAPSSAAAPTDPLSEYDKGRF